MIRLWDCGASGEWRRRMEGLMAELERVLVPYWCWPDACFGGAGRMGWNIRDGRRALRDGGSSGSTSEGGGEVIRRRRRGVGGEVGGRGKLKRKEGHALLRP